MDFLLDVVDSPVHRSDGHIQRYGDFNPAFRFHTQIEHTKLIRGEVTERSKSLTLRLGELSLDVHGAITP